MKILSVASECVPLIKTGGLADVAGALPGALAPLGIEMRTLVPGYRRVMAQLPSKPKTVLRVPDCFGGVGQVLEGKLGTQPLYVLDAPHLFDRDGGPYLDEAGNDWHDNAERFAALSWVAALIAKGSGKAWRPDLVHVHDWQAGLAPLYMRQMGAEQPSLLSIHNIAFQGIAPAHKLAALRIMPDMFTPDSVEYWGNISALKAGLVHSTKLSTVSPTYAAELMRPTFGMGLQGVLQARKGDLHGILNGIDLDVWTPPFKTLSEKRRLTTALRKELGLPKRNGPLCVVVSRLSDQKGLDMLLEALPTLTGSGAQLAMLGSGDKGLEHAFLQASRHEDISVTLGYDEALAQRLIAGGDVILVPSRFEPCGLTQLYGLRYATLPLVALTGGLADTIIPATAATLARGVATGFQFSPIDTQALEGALMKMATLYRDRKTWGQMQRNAQRHPVGWEVSAAHYASLYKDMLNQ